MELFDLAKIRKNSPRAIPKTLKVFSERVRPLSEYSLRGRTQHESLGLVSHQLRYLTLTIPPSIRVPFYLSLRLSLLSPIRLTTCPNFLELASCQYFGNRVKQHLCRMFYPYWFPHCKNHLTVFEASTATYGVLLLAEACSTDFNQIKEKENWMRTTREM